MLTRSLTAALIKIWKVKKKVFNKQKTSDIFYGVSVNVHGKKFSASSLIIPVTRKEKIVLYLLWWKNEALL